MSDPDTASRDVKTQQPAGGDDGYPEAAYAWYVVGVLTLAYMVSFLDRQVMALLIDPIRRDLELSDTQISLLLGLAFSIFYTLLGVPIGRLADRRSRRGIIAVGITIWCFMTAACGLARNFWQLFLARVGVGVGEAALNPSALSMISDYFPRERRGRAISVYNMGVSLGAGIAYIVGGWIIGLVNSAPPVELPVVGELLPWQTVFVIVGMPGLVIALLMATVREPSRKGRITVTDASGRETQQISIREALRFIGVRWRTYGTHMLGMSVVTIIGYGLFFWVPTMYIRTWNWDITEISFAYGLLNLIFGPIGVTLAGTIADRRYRRGEKDSLMRVCLAFMLIFVPASALAPLMPSGELAIAVLPRPHGRSAGDRLRLRRRRGAPLFVVHRVRSGRHIRRRLPGCEPQVLWTGGGGDGTRRVLRVRTRIHCCSRYVQTKTLSQQRCQIFPLHASRALSVGQRRTETG